MFLGMTIVHSGVQMETRKEFLNFHLIMKDHINISQFTKSEVLSLDCYWIAFKQSLKKLETLYGVWACGVYTMKHKTW